MAKLDSISTDIEKGEFTFEQAVLALSQDKDTRNSKGLMVNPATGNSRFEMSELPQEIAREVSKMKEGDISKPFIMMDPKMGREVAVMVRLKNRIEGHKANISDDYQQIKAIVENQKKGEFIEEWIKEKQKTTYVKIKEGWQKCDFKYDGWQIAE